MTISGNQVNAVIRTYLKHTRNRLTNITPSPCSLQGNAALTISEDAKTIFYERIRKRVVEKLRTQAVKTQMTPAGVDPYRMMLEAR